MENESLREIWEEICFHLSDNVNPNTNENVFEQIVLRTLLERLLGWSQFRGEIKVKPQLHIGRQNIITPDIVLHAPDNKAVVLEIKRPAEELNRPVCFGQLQSYMRQTRAEFGILLGKEIHVYYEGSLSSELHDPLLLSKISFNSDSAKGMEFVDLFYKDNFIARKYEPYLQAHVERLKRERQINIFRGQLISEDTKSKVLEFLKNEFSSIGNDILTDAIRGISINISYQQSNSIHYDETESRSETLSVCKNKSSNKYFIYLEDLPNNEFHLVNPEGRFIGLPSDHFEQPKEENLDYLLSYKLITEQQLEKFNEYESRTDNPDIPDEDYRDRIEGRGVRAGTRIQNERIRRRLPFGCTVDGKHFNHGSSAKNYLIQILKVPRKDLPTCSTNWHQWLMDNQARYNFKYQRDRE